MENRKHLLSAHDSSHAKRQVPATGLRIRNANSSQSPERTSIKQFARSIAGDNDSVKPLECGDCSRFGETRNRGVFGERRCLVLSLDVFHAGSKEDKPQAIRFSKGELFDLTVRDDELLPLGEPIQRTQFNQQTPVRCRA